MTRLLKRYFRHSRAGGNPCPTTCTSGKAWIPACAGMTNWTLYLAFLLPLAALLFHAFSYYPYFVDDAFISLRYADRLIHGQGLTWNDGEHVEGYSNLLFVLLTAGLGRLGFDLVAAARAICFLASVATLCAFTRYGSRRPQALLFANLAFALTAPVAIWSLGGMECTLLMALLSWAYILALELLAALDIKKAALTGALLGLVCLTRPEGAIFTLLIAASLLAFAPAPRKHMLSSLLPLCAIPFLFFAAQLAFRIYYYHDILPNTFYVKVAFTENRLINGAMYVIKALASFLPLLLVIALKADKLPSRRGLYMLLTIGTGWLILLIVGGGDFFPGYRHMLPVIPIIILLVTDGFAAMCDGPGKRGSYAFIAYILACFLWLQCSFDENIQARTERNEVTAGEALAKTLARRYGDSQPLVAVTVAGIIPYYSHLPSLDMYGLTDTYATHHKSAEFGHGFVGHELFDNSYILSRRPDIIIFFIGKTPPLHGMSENPEFLKNYRPEIISLPEYDAQIWVRKKWMKDVKMNDEPM